MTKPFREQIAYIINPWVMEPQEGVPFFPDDFPPKATALALADDILALIIQPELREASACATQGEFDYYAERVGALRTIRTGPSAFHVADNVYVQDARLITLAVNRIRELLA